MSKNARCVSATREGFLAASVRSLPHNPPFRAALNLVDFVLSRKGNNCRKAAFSVFPPAIGSYRTTEHAGVRRTVNLTLSKQISKMQGARRRLVAPLHRSGSRDRCSRTWGLKVKNNLQKNTLQKTPADYDLWRTNSTACHDSRRALPHGNF
jgi:hypothetical protein